MEETKPFLYAYSPFGLCATDLGTEQRYLLYNTSSQPPTSFNESSPAANSVYSAFSDFSCLTSATSDKRKMHVSKPSQGYCPRCCNLVSDSVNWCSSCGELLLGASVCSSERSEWNGGDISFRQSQRVHPEPVNFTSELFSNDTGSSFGCIQSYSMEKNHNLFDAHANFHRHATPAFVTEHSEATNSFALNSSLTTRHNEVLKVDKNTVTRVVAEQTNQAFHVAEASVPSAAQVEFLQSVFDDLQLKNESSVSISALKNMDPTLQEYAAPCLQTVHAGSPRITSPHLDQIGLPNAAYQTYCNLSGEYNCSPMERIMEHLNGGRQRCISGPIDNSLLPAENAMSVNFRRFDYPFVASPRSFIDFGSPGQEHGVYFSDSWPTSSSISSVPHAFPASLTSLKPEVVSIAEPVSSSVTQCSSVPALRHDFRKPEGIRRRRQKHVSECSKSRLFPLLHNERNENGFRPRSSSSDFRSSTRNSSRLISNNGNRLQCLWPSSRIAWSAHDPACFKKKPASYLRGVFFHGSSTPANVYRSSHSNAAGRGNANRSSGPLRPVSRSAQPKIRGEHVVHEEHGLSRLSHPTTITNDVPVVSFARVERRPRKCSKRKSTRRGTDTVNGNHPHNSTGRSARPEVGDQAGSQSRSTLTQTSSRLTQNNSVVATASTNGLNWLSLPDELWLSIIRFLPTEDRGRFAQVCRRFANLAVDRSLWRVIQLHRYQHLTDDALISIGRLRPRELCLTYCRGDSLGEEGLRCLFKACGAGLQKLSFIGCTKGPFDRDIPFLLAAEHCPNLSHVNASYTQAVRDHTVMALAKSAFHLVSVKLNGAQHISNAAIQQLVHYHKDTLQRLELFGCFRLNSDIFRLLGRCQKLRALAFGHLHHLSSDGLLELVGKLPHLASLDLRGTQTLANDTNLTRLADKCPHLEEVVLANMHSLKGEDGIAQMLRRLPRLRVLDLCGLSAVGDLTMEALAQSCPYLEELDVSCTSVTQTGLLHLAHVPANYLRCLRISHCREITKEVLETLVKACSKLILLYAYGFNSIKDWNFLRTIRPALLVETET